MNLKPTSSSALFLFVRSAIFLQFASLVQATTAPALYTGTVNIGSVNGGNVPGANNQNVGGQDNQIPVQPPVQPPVQAPVQIPGQVSGPVASQVPSQVTSQTPIQVPAQVVTQAPAQNQNLGDANGQAVEQIPSQTNGQPAAQAIATQMPSQASNLVPSQAEDQAANILSQNLDEPIVTSLESLDGPTFLANVMKVTKLYRHNEMIAAYSTAAMLPVSPTVDYAVVCFQRTRKGIFKVNSRNPAFQGMMTSKADLDAYFQLFKLNKGSTFNYNIPINADGSGNVYTFYGQVFLKHGDGLANGDTICFARYK